MNQSFEKLAKKGAKWLDPKLEPYREHRQTTYTPATLSELLGVLKRTPKSVLSAKERNIIAAAMSFQSTRVRQLMIPRSEITFVYENDYLGPLMLDKLYKSGFSHFPVLNTKGEVVGVLHTALLNSLEIRNTDRASSYLDKAVYYLRDDYNLEQAFAAFLRTNCYFFLVVDRTGGIVGQLHLESLVEHLLGEEPADDFDRDGDSYAVSHRIL